MKVVLKRKNTQKHFPTARIIPILFHEQTVCGRGTK